MERLKEVGSFVTILQEGDNDDLGEMLCVICSGDTMKVSCGVAGNSRDSK